MTDRERALFKRCVRAEARTRVIYRVAEQAFARLRTVVKPRHQAPMYVAGTELQTGFLVISELPLTPVPEEFEETYALALDDAEQYLYKILRENA